MGGSLSGRASDLHRRSLGCGSLMTLLLGLMDRRRHRWRWRRRRLGQADVDQPLDRIAGLSDAHMKSADQCDRQRALNENDRGERHSALPRSYIRPTLGVCGHKRARFRLAVVAAPRRRRRAVDGSSGKRAANCTCGRAEDAAADQAMTSDRANRTAGDKTCRAARVAAIFLSIVSAAIIVVPTVPSIGRHSNRRRSGRRQRRPSDDLRELFHSNSLSLVLFRQSNDKSRRVFPVDGR